MNGATFEPGASGQAFSFDGVNDFVELGDVLNGIAVPFSIAGWVRSARAANPIFASDDLLSYYGFWFQISESNQLAISYGDGRGCASPSCRRTKIGTPTLPLNQWIHVAAVVRGPTDMSLFVNGSEIAGTYSGAGLSMVHSASPARVGRRQASGFSYYFSGAIDELAVYNVALTTPDVAELSRCGAFADKSVYGPLLFPPLCTRDASNLTEDVYASTSIGMARGPGDVFYLSSDGMGFTPLVVDDAVHMNGLDAGLGPYSYQPDVPPFLLDVPIKRNLVPLPARDVTDLIPSNQGTVLFELLDTRREIYGNTAVYLVRDCGIWLSGDGEINIHWVTHDDQVAGTSPEFDVRYGLLSDLLADRNFSRASCLGHFFATPATASLPTLPPGDGYYFLSRGLSSCVQQGYGDSSLVPDPRDALDTLPACP